MNPGLLRWLPANSIAPATARQALRDWLDAQLWPPDEADDLVLAASEAVTNAVEHAGATRVLLEADADPAGHLGRCIRVRVTDNGRWRPRAARTDDSRRGLALMRACVDRVELDSTGQGTRVRLTSHPLRHGSTSRHADGPSWLWARRPR